MKYPLRARRTSVPALVLLLLGSLLAAVFTAPGSSAESVTPLRTSTASNPLVSGPWPHYTGHAEGAYAAWRDSTGTTKDLLAKIALRPRVIWFTDGSKPAGATELVRQRIRDFQRGNPDAYAQLAVFGLYPKGESRRTEPFTNAMQDTYKAWINNVARGIGSSKVILVLEPDLAVAWTGWRPNVRFALAAYASRVLSKLPNVTIYLDGSSADWLPADKAVRMLVRAGVRNVHGIALGSTHYDSVSSNILYGATLVRRLAARGYPGKRVVIDTADNGRPFTHKQFYARFPNGAFDNANLCRTKTELRCLTLGIPPTTNVASTRWGMSLKVRNTAATYVDAFLWFGRPWLYKQATPFQLHRALAVARTTRY